MLYARYAPMVHGVLLARVRKQDADDLTQDVFVQAMKRLSDVRDGGAVGAWLAAIARNAAVTAGRRARPAALPEQDLVAARDETKGETEEAVRVLAMIRGLPEAYRETLVLRLVEGLTGPQIAERMGMTHGSVRVNLHRGMQILKERLGECGGQS
jgi:RNA polymerase sigma-70 factor (ECF subfamily)